MVLVGAGPGDPGLITVRGLSFVRAAEVIVYDALGATSFLEFAPPGAELINAGKRAGEHTLSQDEINATLVRKAGEGKLVVRLKGGDPMVFGRGGEELEALAAAGIPFEVVPGVTSAISGPCYAGIPVTHRDFTSEVAIVTGHDAEPGAAAARDPVPWASLAGLRTVVFLMGVRQLPNIVGHLVAAGKDPATPVAIVEQATTPRQRCITGTLATIAEEAARAAVKPPSIIVVGRVVGLRDRLAWLEKRPLFGRTIVVTRSRAQAGEFCRRLEDLGATVLPFPTIRIEKIRPNQAFDAFVAALDGYSHLVFTSVNGAEAFWENLLEAGKDARALAGKKIICIGPVTAAEFRRHGITPDVVPDTYVVEALLPHFRAAAPPESSTHAFPVSSISEAAPRASSCQLPGRVSGPGKAGDGSPPTPASGQNGFATGVATGDGTASRVRRVAILRAETARDVLPDTLTREGWEVDVVVLYRTLSETAAPPAALAALRERRVDAVTFTSSSTVDGFLGLIEGQNLALEDIPAVSIGPVTADTIRRHGLRLLGTAPVHTIPGLVDQLLDLFRP